MEVAVWDTYVKREGGKIMHFDILVESENQDKVRIFDFGMEYLKDKSFNTEVLTTNECKFCHIEQANQELEMEIVQKGYAIIEMENCD